MAAGRVTATAAAVLLLFSCAAAASTTCYDALSLGGFHGLALSRGTVTGFGEGAASQLDVPSSTAGRALAVAAGGFFSCALHTAAGSSGTNATTVTCWGGSGSTAVTSVPTSVASDGGVRALAAGGYHACAALSNGSAVCWGANGAGQVSPLPAAVGTSGVASLALGSYHSCAIVGGAGASVACWGRDDFGQVSGAPTALASGSGGSSSLRLACGGYHCCAWRAGGAGSSLSCWGAAAAGQTTVPAAVAAASNVSAACAGGYFSCAVVNGSVSCWGASSKGETVVPAAARDGSVAAVSCGWYGACALSLSGGLTCWGGDLGVQAAAASGGQDVVIATADAAGTASASGSVLIASGAVAAGAGGGASGAISITTGAATGTNASSSAIVVATGATTNSGSRGAISLLAPTVVAEQSVVVGGTLSIGGLTLTAADVQSLVALAARASSGALLLATATPAVSPTPSSSPAPQVWTVTTLAGSGTGAFANGQGTAAAFWFPASIALASSGTLYIADQGNHRIRVISASGSVTTLAGSGAAAFADGQGTAAAFNAPTGIAVDASGNLYVVDTNNNRIRKISATGAVTTLAGNGTAGYADGLGTAAAFYSPNGVAVDVSGTVYVSDQYNHRIRKISPSGTVTTLAGSGASAYADGQGTAASFNQPNGVAVDATGAVYVTDTGNNRIRKISAGGAVTTLAGSGTGAWVDGQGTGAAFSVPVGVTVDSAGVVYVVDRNSNRVRRIDAAGTVTTLAGNGTAGYTDGQGTAAAFNRPFGVAVDTSSGTLYVTDSFNHRIRKISPSSAASISPTFGISPSPSTTASSSASPTPSATATGSPTPSASAAPLAWTVTTLAGNGTAGYTDGQGTAATFSFPHGVAVDSAGTIYVGDYNNHRIRMISAAGAVTTLAGGSPGYADGQGAAAAFSQPRGMAVDAAGTLYVADTGNHRVRKVTPGGNVTTLAGNGTAAYSDGQGASVSFKDPFGVAVAAGGVVYVADAGNHAIRKISATGAVTTLAGSGSAGYADGQGTGATFNGPWGIAVDASGAVYVADYYNHRIRKISAAGAVTTLAGSAQGYADGQGAAAAFSFPWGVAVDASGVVYVADRYNNRVRKIDATGTVTTIAGNGSTAYADGQGTAAAFYYPEGIAVDTSSGTLYVADTYSNRVRKVSPGGPPSASPAPASPSSSPSGAAQVTASPSGTPSLSTAASRSASPTPSATATGSPTPSASASPLVWTVTTLAGSGSPAYADGQGTAAALHGPHGVAVDSAGNVYVADLLNFRIRKISAAGAVTTLAGGSPGYADGQGTAAAFSIPRGVAVDASGVIYVADTNNNRIRKISASGAVTTLAGNGTAAYADGLGTAAAFNLPFGVAVDASGVIYVADSGNNRIRKISPTGAVTTLAGSGASAYANGQGTAAAFNNPFGIAVDAVGTVFVADYSSNSIRKVSPAGAVTTLAGNNGSPGYVDGQGAAAAFNGPWGVAVDASGAVFVADANNNRIRRIDATGAVTTLAGSTAGYADGVGAAAAFSAPYAVAADASGAVYVADYGNNRIRKVSPGGPPSGSPAPASPSSSPSGAAQVTASPSGTPSLSTAASRSASPTPSATATASTSPSASASPLAWTVTTLAGSGSPAYADGQGTAATFGFPAGVALTSSGALYIADQGNHRIRVISPAGTVTTLAGNGTAAYADGQGTSAAFSDPTGIAVDASGNVYVADTLNNRIRKISPSGAVTTLAGNGTAGYADGQGAAAAFNSPADVAVASGNVYVADMLNHRIRKISAAGAVTTLAGSGSAGYADGQGAAASFNQPNGVAVDSSGNVYVGDLANNRIRKISAAGAVTTLAGSGTAAFADGQGTGATFNGPIGVAVDASGVVYVVDRNNNRIRRIDATGAVTTLAGNGTAGYADGQGTSAAFKVPFGVAVDSSSGTLYVTDSFNHRVRKVSPSGAVPVSASPSGTPSPSITASRSASPTPSVTATTSTLPSASPGPLQGWNVTTIAGGLGPTYADGQGTATAFNFPAGVAVDSVGVVYVADSSNQRIRKISLAGAVTTLAGNGTAAYADGQGVAAAFNGPVSVAVDASGNVYVADFSSHRIRKISPSGAVVTLAGNGTAAYADGQGTAAAFSKPLGIAVDAAGNVYVADYGNNRIRAISPSGAVTTLAGNGTAAFADGQSTSAAFSQPAGIAIDASGNVYVADLANNRIRKISATGAVTTLAGNGTAAYADGQGAATAFYGPYSVAADASGDVYVADTNNNRIRKISAAGAVTTLAGSGAAAYLNGQGTAAAFKYPTGVAIDSSGALYVADQLNHRIRKIIP